MKKKILKILTFLLSISNIFTIFTQNECTITKCSTGQEPKIDEGIYYQTGECKKLSDLKKEYNNLNTSEISKLLQEIKDLSDKLNNEKILENFKNAKLPSNYGINIAKQPNKYEEITSAPENYKKVDDIFHGPAGLTFSPDINACYSMNTLIDGHKDQEDLVPILEDIWNVVCDKNAKRISEIVEKIKKLANIIGYTLPTINVGTPKNKYEFLLSEDIQNFISVMQCIIAFVEKNAEMEKDKDEVKKVTIILGSIAGVVLGGITGTLLYKIWQKNAREFAEANASVSNARLLTDINKLENLKISDFASYFNIGVKDATEMSKFFNLTEYAQLAALSKAAKIGAAGEGLSSAEIAKLTEIFKKNPATFENMKILSDRGLGRELESQLKTFGKLGDEEAAFIAEHFKTIVKFK